MIPLQWRAEQLPGQTPPANQRPFGGSYAFNGGPSNCPAKRCRSHEYRAIACPFNGGPSNCPAKPALRCQRSFGQEPFNGGPSNCPAKQPATCATSPTSRTFNGGPSNCPAKRPGHHRGLGYLGHPSMEGRAIARPNCPLSVLSIPEGIPSMEGRAIARPNLGAARPGWHGRATFNGGPSNCPAKQEDVASQGRGCSRPSMEGRAIARPNCGSVAVRGA